MQEDRRSNKFVFVPFCLMCQAFQARGIVKYDWTATIKPIMQELLKHNVNIIQLPCPESQLGGWTKGLSREPMGYKGYNISEFRELCENLAGETIGMIEGIIDNRFEVKAILGIEMSPSCAVNYQYTNKGTTHLPGVFMQSLMKGLKDRKIEIPFIGINRKFINKGHKQLTELLDQDKQLNMLEKKDKTHDRE